MDIFHEVVAPDELLDYKGVHFKYKLQTSDFVTDYGVVASKFEIENGNLT